MTLISIVIPSYNVEAYLQECIDSVLKQTQVHFEIIIVDNNSTDGTLRIAQENRSRYPELIRIVSEKNQGAAFARNAGLLVANGDWIQFLDADDLIHQDKLRVQYAMIDSHTKLVVGAWYYQLVNGLKLEEAVKNGDLARFVFCGKGCGQTSANLWSKSYLMQVKGFDEAVPDTNDHEIMLRLALLDGKIQFCSELLTTVRDRHDKSNLSQEDIRGHYYRHIALRSNFIERLREERPTYHLENQLYLWHCVYWYCRLLSSHNLNCGIKAYYSVMPKDFKPTFILELDNPKWHIFLTKWIGFSATEKLKFGFRKIFPKRIT